jgi:hypothetical protein
VTEPAAIRPAPTANGTVAASVEGACRNNRPRDVTLSASRTATAHSTIAATNDSSRKVTLTGTPKMSESEYASRSSDSSSIRPSGRKLPSRRKSGNDRMTYGTSDSGSSRNIEPYQ